MVKWEYKILHHTLTKPVTLATFNELGLEGWEFVSTDKGYYPNPEGVADITACIFKRPLLPSRNDKGIMED